MGVGYQKFKAGSPDGYLGFGVISTPDVPGMHKFICTNLGKRDHRNLVLIVY